MNDKEQRKVTLERLDEGVYLARNARGTNCGSAARRRMRSHRSNCCWPRSPAAPPSTSYVVTGRQLTGRGVGATIEARYVRDESGNRLEDIRLNFQVTFPDGEAGDAARQILPRVLKQAHDRTCTVLQDHRGGDADHGDGGMSRGSRRW
jgi:hypothetical protein